MPRSKSGEKVVLVTLGTVESVAVGIGAVVIGVIGAGMGDAAGAPST